MRAEHSDISKTECEDLCLSESRLELEGHFCVFSGNIKTLITIMVFKECLEKTNHNRIIIPNDLRLGR